MRDTLRQLGLEETSEMTRLIDSVLKRVGFDHLWLNTIPSQDMGSSLAGTPTFDLSYLTRLRQTYAAFDAFQHSQWSEKYIASEVNLSRFRADSAFMWQYRDANLPVAYLATYYWLKGSLACDLLRKCSEDSRFGAYCVETDGELISRDRLDSVCQLAFLRTHLGMDEHSSVSLLDIGSGYGRFAWRLNQAFPRARCFCADAIPEATFLCDYYLRFRNASNRIKIVELPDLDATLLNTHIDCALAINSLTECSAQSVRWWLRRLCDHNILYLFVAPDGNYRRGRELRTTEELGRHSLDMRPILEEYGFVLAVQSPKYTDPAVQRFGISPTTYHLYVRK